MTTADLKDCGLRAYRWWRAFYEFGRLNMERGSAGKAASDAARRADG